MNVYHFEHLRLSVGIEPVAHVDPDEPLVLLTWARCSPLDPWNSGIATKLLRERSREALEKYVKPGSVRLTPSAMTIQAAEAITRTDGLLALNAIASRREKWTQLALAQVLANVLLGAIPEQKVRAYKRVFNAAIAAQNEEHAACHRAAERRRLTKAIHGLRAKVKKLSELKVQVPE